MRLKSWETINWPLGSGFAFSAVGCGFDSQLLVKQYVWRTYMFVVMALTAGPGYKSR